MPLLTVNGKKFWPLFFRLLLLVLGLFCIYIAVIVHFIAIVLSIYFFVTIFFVSTKVIKVYSDKFVVERISILKNLNKIEEYLFSDLKTVNYYEGKFNFTNLVFSFLGGYHPESPISTSDLMLVIKKNDKKINIKRIGSKEKFLNLINTIKEKLV